MNNLLQQWQLFSFSHARVFQISPFSPNGSSKESVVGVERELFKPKERRWHSRLGSTHTLHCLPVAEDEWPEFTHHLLLHIFAHTCLFSSKANPSKKTRLQYDFRIIVIKGPLSTMKAIKCLWWKKIFLRDFWPNSSKSQVDRGEGWQGRCPGARKSKHIESF